MRAPTNRHVYTCPCGRRVIGVQGDGTWRPWDELMRLAEEHEQECPRAAERWILALPGTEPAPSNE